MERYSKLTDRLRDSNKITLTFDEIEAIIGDKLPESESKHRPWWGNETTAKSRHCKAWMEAGYEVEEVKIKDRTVRFRKA